jgi:biopolymer transport protein ExbD
VSRTLRRRGALHQWEAHFGPNMTPMVDVVMVILIFFMAGASFVGPEWFMPVAVPRIGGEGAPADPFTLPPARFTITLRAGPDGRTLGGGLGLGEVQLDTLAGRLTALAEQTRGADLVVIVRPEPEVPYQDAVTVFDACSAAGITQVGLSAD